MRGPVHPALRALAIVSVALLGLAGRAAAAETIYWDNYGATPVTIGYANIDGTFGGVLNNHRVAAPGTEVEIYEPEGLAYDPANGRIYIANSGKDQILWIATDGSGAGVLDTGGAPVLNPKGIAVDPQTQTVYWANSVPKGSIAYAAAGGGNGGLLNTTGASILRPERVALDPVDGRIYWVGDGGGERLISYAALNGGGGANLPVPTGPGEGFSELTALNVDPMSNRLYVLTPGGIVWRSTVGLGGGFIELKDPTNFDIPIGMAFDPAKGRFYWANYGHGAERANAFGTTTLATGSQATVLGIATAPLLAPQDPVIVKSPVGIKPPVVTPSRAALICDPGAWEADSPGSYVYAAPTSHAYRWSKDGTVIPGATSMYFAAGQSGTYTCTETAYNRSGSASQTSAGIAVAIEGQESNAQPPPKPPGPKPAELTLRPATRGPVKVKAGKAATIKVDLTNGGGTASGAVKVCGKRIKRARKGLVAPKCTSVASVPAGGMEVAKLTVKTKTAARGAYKLRLDVSGALNGSLTAKVKVLAAKPKRPKHVAKGR